MVRNVVEVREELDLDDHRGCGFVFPSPDPFGAWLEADRSKGTIKPGTVHGAALDFQVHLDVHVRDWRETEDYVTQV